MTKQELRSLAEHPALKLVMPALLSMALLLLNSIDAHLEEAQRRLDVIEKMQIQIRERLRSSETSIEYLEKQNRRVSP